jgi:hypothetical protein
MLREQELPLQNWRAEETCSSALLSPWIEFVGAELREASSFMDFVALEKPSC